ncbi:tetratricopeptide repeat protein [Thiothrix lacustris]|uniref:tetratricopeptide repeat protein n=1 Tax=Thiothrix lacustris TaxID=525917 RepID=UPI00048D6886|nr:tetratricopeptide repeat protein [Thiothrix lacustris]WMP16483.1 tetratricopeptide repeat protein [Thiothrix lacustris]
MTLTPRNTLVLSVVLTGFLSACSPNPAVLQDRVYGSRAVPAPAPAKVAPAKPAAIARPKAPAPTVSTVVVTKPVKVPPPMPAPVPKPEAQVSVIAEPAPATTVTPVAPVIAVPKVYQSSSAVQALVRQADTEVAKGSLDKAADTLERALRIEGDNPDLWMKLAKINEQQGKHDQAVSMVGKAQSYREQLN